MRKIITILLLLFFTPTFSFSQTQGKQISKFEYFVLRSSTPPEIWHHFEVNKLHEKYDINYTHLNPFYLYGDFDSDGKFDFVLLLTNKNNKKTRLVVFMGNNRVEWLDRDKELKYPSLTAWYIYPHYKKVGPGVSDKPLPKLKGDAIIIIKVESSSSLIYWNGKRFVSYWQGD